MRFWDASGVCLYPMYKLSTAGVFHTDADPNDNMNQGTEGEWPPFRKVCVIQSAADVSWMFFINQTLLVTTSHKPNSAFKKVFKGPHR